MFERIKELVRRSRADDVPQVTTVAVPSAMTGVPIPPLQPPDDDKPSQSEGAR